MTKIPPHLTDMIARINELPDASIRFVAMIGLARVLPQEEGEEVELEGLPFTQELAWVEAEIPQGRFTVDSANSLTIDPDEQLPRSDFYFLVDEVAAIKDPSIRSAAFAHVITCILSKPCWVAW